MEYSKTVIFREAEIEAILDRLVQSVISGHKSLENVVLIGILSTGYPLAERVAKRIKKQTKFSIPVGKLDVSLYRDDLLEKGNFVTIRESNIPDDIHQKEIVLIDDVLSSGRTARAAIDAILDHGRPQQISLAVLIDREHRELPITADFVGEIVHVASNERIEVNLFEIDGEDTVSIISE